MISALKEISRGRAAGQGSEFRQHSQSKPLHVERRDLGVRREPGWGWKEVGAVEGGQTLTTQGSKNSVHPGSTPKT